MKPKITQLLPLVMTLLAVSCNNLQQQNETGEPTEPAFNVV